MKKIVLVNEDFDDVYTGEHYKSGDNVVMTDERITEVKGVNPNLVTVIGAAEDTTEISPTEFEELKAKLAETEAKLKETEEKLEKAEAKLKEAKSK
jgi:chromosome segregation ATPase